MDKEFVIMENIDHNSFVTQRELSEKTGISLGSVNILLNKMVSEGLIKVEKIPANRVMYMLTPKGMVEKINKTYNYIRLHYKRINETKEKVKALLNGLLTCNKYIYILTCKDEINELLKTAVREIGYEDRFIFKDTLEQAVEESQIIIVYSHDDKEKYEGLGYKVINILEEI